MDLDHLEGAIKFEPSEFPIETDSYLHSKCIPEFKIEEEEEEQYFHPISGSTSPTEIIDHLKKAVDIIDAPIEDLILGIQDEYDLSPAKEDEVYNILRKTKLILKR